MQLKFGSLKTTKAITLIELIVVIAIIGIIASVAFPTYQAQIRETRRKDAINSIREMQLAVDAYILKHGGLPTVNDFPSKNSAENWYTISYMQQNADTYKIQAVAKAGTSQATDTANTANGASIDCSTIYITNQLDTTYPYECN